MGARKLKEFKHLPELRALRKPELERKPVIGFIVLILFAVVIAAILFKSDESKQDKEHTEQNKTETLEEFVKRAIAEKATRQEKYPLGNVTQANAKIIAEIAGVDVGTYIWLIDNYSVKHITKKHREIKLNDYNRLYQTLNTHDYIKLASNQNKDLIKLEIGKAYERNIVLIIEVRQRQRELYVVTMYKKRKK